jgi:hypothetical protein
VSGTLLWSKLLGSDRSSTLSRVWAQGARYLHTSVTVFS